jgi:UDP:flavonoid glycosyltransferase YjiC (YdhE family)
MVWLRLVTSAVVLCALARPALRGRARELQAWAAANDGPERAADLVEAFAAG